MSGHVPKVYAIYGQPRFRRSALVSELRKMLQGRAERAFLFGSYATGQAHASSDIDLLVIARTERPFVERFRDFHDVVSALAPIDLIVYTPEEWAEIARAPSPFWVKAKREWISLFPRPVASRSRRKASQKRGPAKRNKTMRDKR